jgi:hypothetical protein
MNNMKKIVSVTVSGFIILFLLLLVFMPKESFSEKENRYLQEFPSFNFADVASGDYMSDLSSWFNDCFPFRDTFVGLKTAF